MASVRQLNMIKENILDLLQDIDNDRINGNGIRKKDITRLSALLESFSVFSKESRVTDYINESAAFDNKYDKLVAEYRYNRKKMNAILEGFSNPFDTEDSVSRDAYEYMKEMDPSYKNPGEKKVNISSIRLWNPDVNDKIYYKDGKMNAGKFFGAGDVIERCPVRLLSDKELYSRTIRDFAFPVDAERRIYAIPFGYASYYRDSKSSPSEANATYVYDDSEASMPVIKIIATKKISRGNEIVLASTDADYANELTADTFHYPKGEFVCVKNIKFA